MKKNILIGLSIVLVSFFQTGCASYSFRGAHSLTPQKTSSCVDKYRLVNFNSNIPTSLSPWPVAQFAGVKVAKCDVESELVKKYPNKFTREKTAIPIDISVSVKDSDVEWFAGFSAYFFSLGFYPANIINYKEQCDVTVCAQNTSETGSIKFRSKGWLSAFNPAGNSQTDEKDGYTGSHTSGGGVFSAPHQDRQTFQKQKRVFISEVVAEAYISILNIEMDNEKQLSTTSVLIK